MSCRNTELLEPVEAYDRLASQFEAVSESRQAYLLGVEGIILQSLPAGAESLLDIGAADGRRALRIAATADISNVTLLEPSAEMRRAWPPRTDSCSIAWWPTRAEDLAATHGSFDVIVCLWNVLGHIFPEAARKEVLNNIARLLSPEGRAFVDVSHRYNVRHYGLAPTLVRALRDLFFRSPEVRDVRAAWNVAGEIVSTKGHVFTQCEMRRLIQGSGLRIVQQHAVDYQTGQTVASRYRGHLLYEVAVR